MAAGETFNLQADTRTGKQTYASGENRAGQPAAAPATYPEKNATCFLGETWVNGDVYLNSEGANLTGAWPVFGGGGGGGFLGSAVCAMPLWGTVGIFKDVSRPLGRCPGVSTQVAAPSFVITAHAHVVVGCVATNKKKPPLTCKRPHTHTYVAWWVVAGHGGVVAGRGGAGRDTN